MSLIDFIIDSQDLSLQKCTHLSLDTSPLRQICLSQIKKRNNEDSVNLLWNNETVLYSASNLCLEPQIGLGTVPASVQKQRKGKECVELCVINDYCELKFVEHLFITGT